MTFDLPHTVTTFRAMVDGVSPGGYFGQTDALILSQLPMYSEVKVCSVSYSAFPVRGYT